MTSCYPVIVKPRPRPAASSPSYDPILSPRDLGLPSKFSTYRKHQAETILNIAGSPFRFPILQAPTGSGKSPIYYSVSKLLGARTLILVTTKNLENQLLTDFSSSGLLDIRGHSNYRCATVTYDDDSGEMADLICHATREDCNYWQQVEGARRSQEVETNYSHWIQLLKSGDPDRLGKFDLLVCDEAHLIDLKMTDWISISLNERTIANLLRMDFPDTLDDIDVWQDWCSQALTNARDYYRRLKKERVSEKTLAKLTYLGQSLSRFLRHSKVDTWVAKLDAKSNRHNRIVQLCPVWVGRYTEEYLYRDIPKILLVSGTIAEEHRKYLGIGHDTYDYLELPSTFPAPNRPFIFIPTTVVKHDMTSGQKRLLVRRMDQVIASRLDRKGIAHTRAYSRSAEILELSKACELSEDLQFIVPRRGYESKGAIDRFIHADPPAFLMSPAIEEGHDFANDLARYQIIVKVPFCDSRDPVLAARIKSGQAYRNLLAAQSILQMYGRIVRSEDDWGECFIFDDQWKWFRNKIKWPKYFKAAWRYETKIPDPLKPIPVLRTRKVLSTRRAA